MKRGDELRDRECTTSRSQLRIHPRTLARDAWESRISTHFDALARGTRIAVVQTGLWTLFARRKS